MNAYLVLVTWPDKSEGLLFPRPGHVPIADSMEMGQTDFDTARKHLHVFAAQNPKRFIGATIRLVEFQRGTTLLEYELKGGQPTG